jgi:hypothetical protein
VVDDSAVTDSIEAYQDDHAKLIFLFLPYPAPKIGGARDEGSYYSIEEHIFRWESQLLVIFVSVHTVLLLCSGSRFPVTVLQTLRSLQSAKKALFDAGVFTKGSVGGTAGGCGGGGRKLEGGQHSQLECVPSLAFFMHAPVALLRRGVTAAHGSILAFEKAMDAQVREVLDSAGCIRTSFYNTTHGVSIEALFVLHTDKCCHTFPMKKEKAESVLGSWRSIEWGVDVRGSENHLTSLLEAFTPAPQRAAGGGYGDGSGGGGGGMPDEAHTAAAKYNDHNGRFGGLPGASTGGEKDAQRWREWILLITRQVECATWFEGASTRLVTGYAVYLLYWYNSTNSDAAAS